MLPAKTIVGFLVEIAFNSLDIASVHEILLCEVSLHVVLGVLVISELVLFLLELLKNLVFAIGG